jgi:hypothetical protein
LTTSRASAPKVKRQSNKDSEDDDSDWSSGDDYSDDDDDDDESYVDEEEEQEEDYKGLQLKALCVESERVTVEQFAEWKLTYDKWLMENKCIKRVSESDVKPTGKQQFLSVLTNRRSGADAKPGEDFDEELFGEDDVDLDELDEDGEIGMVDDDDDGNNE